MYEAFYGLTGKPFQLNPDPSFYFGSKQHRRARAYLEYGVQRNEGFIVITGEVGAGKTTIVRGLLESLDPNSVVAANLVSTQLDAEDTLRMVGAAFGVRVKDISKADLLMALEAFLVTQTSQGKRCLIIVDEAQNLTPRAVEELRMLSNFQFGKQALLQTFLVGQPEFREILQSPNMQQLRQRVTATCHIGPMDQDETRGYIEHRLKCVGSKGRPSFDLDAFGAIHKASGGIPRRINSICDRLLLLGFLGEKDNFGADDVNEVVDEINEESGGNFSPASAPAPLAHSTTKPRKLDVDFELDISRLQFDDDLADGVSRRVESLSAERYGDRLLRLERSLLRLERVNLEVLTMLQKLVIAAKKRPETERREEGGNMSADLSLRELGPVICVVGARPNFMKMAPILRALSSHVPPIPVLLVHTGQHYDKDMSDRLFEDLRLPKPDINLEVGSASHAVQTAEVMRRFEPVLDSHSPSCVIVVGDVNSTLACTLVAVKKGIPVAHVEAGLRSYDRAMPEEINRILTDQIADRLYTTELSAQDNLRLEGIPAERVCFAGNVMIDSLLASRPYARNPRNTLRDCGMNPEILDNPNGYGVVTLHRPSNVDQVDTLRPLLEVLGEVARKLPLVFALHPRTRSNIERFALSNLIDPLKMVLLPPQGYLEMLGLMSGAALVLTDSGGLQEETTALGVPCLTLRENTERPITVDQGTNILVGTNSKAILSAVNDALVGRGKRGRVPDRWDGKAAERIASDLWLWLQKLSPNRSQ